MKVMAMVAALCLATPAYAIDAKRLVDLCNDGNQDFCTGYIVGAIEERAYLGIGEKPPYCLPDESRYAYVREVVVQHAKNHPDHAKYNANFLIGKALTESFPCRANK